MTIIGGGSEIAFPLDDRRLGILWAVETSYANSQNLANTHDHFHNVFIFEFRHSMAFKFCRRLYWSIASTLSASRFGVISNIVEFDLSSFNSVLCFS